MTTATHYKIVIEPLSINDGGGYVALVPELAGCMSDGATQIEALENVRDAIEQWLDEAKALGRKIPEPAIAVA